jgi:hypothetical protein
MDFALQPIGFDGCLTCSRTVLLPLTINKARGRAFRRCKLNQAIFSAAAQPKREVKAFCATGIDNTEVQEKKFDSV